MTININIEKVTIHIDGVDVDKLLRPFLDAPSEPTKADEKETTAWVPEEFPADIQPVGIIKKMETPQKSIPAVQSWNKPVAAELPPVERAPKLEIKIKPPPEPEPDDEDDEGEEDSLIDPPEKKTTDAPGLKHNTNSSPPNSTQPSVLECEKCAETFYMRRGGTGQLCPSCFKKKQKAEYMKNWHAKNKQR